MSKYGFLKFPRSFTDDEVWQSLSADYRSVFLTLLVNYAWKDTIQDDHGKLTMVKIGQCLMTERQIMNESFPKSEIITKDVPRLIHYFSRLNLPKQAPELSRQFLFDFRLIY